MNEVSMTFGSERHLVGTLTLPARTSPGKVAFLLSNTSVIHRMGPHRFNVKLARELAGRGTVCFCMDIPDQGDSRAPEQAESFERQAVIDRKAAMDHVQRVCGIDQFVVAGICSGALTALATAAEDSRVVGLWMLDGYVYPTLKTQKVRYVHQLKTRLLPTLGSWAHSAVRGGAGRRVKNLLTPPVASPLLIDYEHTTPSKAAFAVTLQALLDRNVNIYPMYSGSVLRYYNYPEQLHDAFSEYGFIHRVRCDCVPDVDHTATTLGAHRQLIDSITHWSRDAFPTHQDT